MRMGWGVEMWWLRAVLGVERQWSRVGLEVVSISIMFGNFQLFPARFVLVVRISVKTVEFFHFIHKNIWKHKTINSSSTKYRMALEKI